MGKLWPSSWSAGPDSSSSSRSGAEVCGDEAGDGDPEETRRLLGGGSLGTMGKPIVSTTKPGSLAASCFGDTGQSRWSNICYFISFVSFIALLVVLLEVVPIGMQMEHYTERTSCTVLANSGRFFMVGVPCAPNDPRDLECVQVQVSYPVHDNSAAGVKGFMAERNTIYAPSMADSNYGVTGACSLTQCPGDVNPGLSMGLLADIAVESKINCYYDPNSPNHVVFENPFLFYEGLLAIILPAVGFVFGFILGSAFKHHPGCMGACVGCVDGGLGYVCCCFLEKPKVYVDHGKPSKRVAFEDEDSSTARAKSTPVWEENGEDDYVDDDV